MTKLCSVKHAHEIQAILRAIKAIDAAIAKLSNAKPKGKLIMPTNLADAITALAAAQAALTTAVSSVSSNIATAAQVTAINNVTTAVTAATAALTPSAS